MAGIKYKYIRMSNNYKCVKMVMDEHGNYLWATTLKGNVFIREKDAAKKVDLIRIAKGKEPVNILVKEGKKNSYD